jgi:hypothetical protein
VGGTRKYLGSFASEVDAAHTYDAAAREVFGNYARLNFPTLEPATGEPT